MLNYFKELVTKLNIVEDAICDCMQDTHNRKLLSFYGLMEDMYFHLTTSINTWIDAFTMNIKQVIVVNSNLGMRKGKTAAQVAHGSHNNADKIKTYNKSLYDRWMMAGFKKVVLTAPEDVMDSIVRQLEEDNAIYTAIHDQGLTQVAPNSFTVLAIGPAFDEKIDKYTGGLKLLE